MSLGERDGQPLRAVEVAQGDEAHAGVVAQGRLIVAEQATDGIAHAAHTGEVGHQGIEARPPEEDIDCGGFEIWQQPPLPKDRDIDDEGADRNSDTRLLARPAEDTK